MDQIQYPKITHAPVPLKPSALDQVPAGPRLLFDGAKGVGGPKPFQEIVWGIDRNSIKFHMNLKDWVEVEGTWRNIQETSK